MERYRSPVNGHRYYYVKEKGIYVPSVTSIIDETSDKSWLQQWKKRIGEKKANCISREAAQRGTVMHLLYEYYFKIKYQERGIGRPVKETFDRVKGHPELKNIPASVKKIGADLFLKFQREKITDQFKNFYFSEEPLWCVKGGGFCGTVDMVAQDWDDRPVIIDFKTARKPKKESQLEDYKLQLGAYTLALYDTHGLLPSRCELWIANESVDFPQIVRVDPKGELKEYIKGFLNRVKQFHNKHSDHGIDPEKDKE